MSGGEFAAPGNWVQLQEGIDNDSPELFYEDLMKGGKISAIRSWCGFWQTML